MLAAFPFVKPLAPSHYCTQVQGGQCEHIDQQRVISPRPSCSTCQHARGRAMMAMQGRGTAMVTSDEKPGLYVQRSRSELRSDALQAIREAIDLIAEAGREPDGWECFCLTHAFSAFRAGTYAMAEVEADIARTPVAQRSLSEVTLDDPVFRVSLAQLQRGLGLAEAEPLQECNSLWW